MTAQKLRKMDDSKFAQLSVHMKAIDSDDPKSKLFNQWETAPGEEDKLNHAFRKAKKRSVYHIT